MYVLMAKYILIFNTNIKTHLYILPNLQFRFYLNLTSFLEGPSGTLFTWYEVVRDQIGLPLQSLINFKIGHSGLLIIIMPFLANV